MNTRNLIIIAILIILAVIVGLFAFTTLQDNSQNGKINTEITFLSGDTLKSGKTVEFQLKDADNNAIIGENITILFEENGENQTYSIVTDNEGKGGLALNNEMPGTYVVYVLYNGTTRFNACNASQTITIEEGYYQPATDSSSEESDTSEPIVSNSSAGTSLYNGNSSTSQNLHYDSQYNFYYDDNGIIRGGQNDGMSADYIREAYSSNDMVDEEGNLQ
ncbi:hypothetical protein [Methanobrevibacter sp.]|uniref:hypothetical protein n=1 Tax=Methanobrevibacter sp. TaxID=66852 RepID=UPI00386CCD04